MNHILINVLQRAGFRLKENKYVLDLNWKYKRSDLEWYSILCPAIDKADESETDNVLSQVECELNEYLRGKEIDEKFHFPPKLKFDPERQVWKTTCSGQQIVLPKEIIDKYC